MTQEEKAKAYDKALEKAKKIKDNPFAGYDGTDLISSLFPELKESEDERIRKELIEFVKSRLAGFPQCEKYIAWLEKQSKKKSINKVEAKFKAGDWIIHNDNKHIPLKIIEKIGMCYRIVDTVNYHHNILINCINENYHLWTIQDAKAGDVLVHNSILFIFMGIENGIVKGICTELSDTILNFGEPEYDNDYCPATNEQRDLLFQKMKEAGYEWDAEKKELKKIEQKPSWSEEDEKRLQSCVNILQAKGLTGITETINTKWLKSLKNRVQPQNLTVTDEELAQAKKEAYNEALDKIEYHSDNPTFDDGWSAAIWYLKKRNAQPQTTWKPSNEQIIALRWVLNNIPYNKHKEEISGLLDQIKEL